eukprot:jgi/Bigna1/88015/estExt_fgenesh1_pg.C_270061
MENPKCSRKRFLNDLVTIYLTVPDGFLWVNLVQILDRNWCQDRCLGTRLLEEISKVRRQIAAGRRLRSAMSTNGGEGSDKIPPEDCLGCRISGTLTLAGMSGYMLYQRQQIPASARTHRGMLTVMGGSLAILSVLRAAGITFGAEKGLGTRNASTNISQARLSRCCICSLAGAQVMEGNTLNSRGCFGVR